MSTRPSAPAAIPARFSTAARCSVIGIDRDQSAIARGADLVAASRRPARAGGGSVLQSCGGRRAAAATTRSTASCSISASRRCSSTRPSAASRSALDGPLDMRMGGAGPSAADVVAHATERDLAAIIATLGEERHARAVARAIVRERAADADSHHPRARRDRRARRACAAGRDPSGDAHLPGAAHVRERGACRACRGARGRRDGAQARRPAGRGRLPFARGSHRQDVPRRARPARRRLAPSAGGDRARATLPPPDRPARSRPTTPRSPPIRARARPSCAPPSAPMRRRRRDAERPAAAAAVARRCRGGRRR